MKRITVTYEVPDHHVVDSPSEDRVLSKDGAHAQFYDQSEWTAIDVQALDDD